MLGALSFSRLRLQASTAMRKLIPRYSIRCLVITTLLVVLFFVSLTTLTGHLHPRSMSKVSLDLLLKTHPKPDKNDDKLVFHEPSGESGLSLEQLKSLVSGKNGYYVRDWSLGLGWNNMRYIIEASVLQAKLLNRVLVIPSFVYARSCEFENDVCSQHAAFVSREGAVGWGEGRYNMAWKLPIEIMLDLPRLRFYHPVILTTEFMRLHGLDPSNERATGYWNRDIHVEHTNMTSFHVIPNPGSFDDDVFRVDTVLPFPSVSNSTDIDAQVDAQFREAAGGEKKALSWDKAVHILRSNGHYIDDHASAEVFMNRAGWVVTYTYEGQGGMEFAKTVIPPTRQVLPRARVRGWVEDFTMDVDVLLLEGETHLERKPGSMRFTTSSARNDYTKFVLSYMHPTSSVISLSEKLAKRMTRLTDGRGWCAAHMRRTDFIQIGWVKDRSLQAHLKYIKGVFEKGRKRLAEQTFWFWKNNNLPKEDDPYFIATDDRTKESLEYIRKNGAVTIYELLTDEERRQLAWPLLFTDVLGLVEQRIVASSAFFYGPAVSSLSGGVLNLRTAMGLDSNSWIVD